MSDIDFRPISEESVFYIEDLLNIIDLGELSGLSSHAPKSPHYGGLLHIELLIDPPLLVESVLVPSYSWFTVRDKLGEFNIS